MSYENARVFRSEVIDKQRAAVSHHRNELFITNPCRVEQDVVAQMANLSDYFTCIVNAAIIGAELNNCQTNRSLSLSLNRVTFSNQLTDVFFIEAVILNAADGTECVTSIFQIYRNSASLNQSALRNGLVVVAVIKNDIAWCENCVQNDLVGCGSTIQYEVCSIAIEYSCCMSFCFARSAVMEQEIAHCCIRAGAVSTEYIWSEEIIEYASSWMLLIGFTNVVAWSCPGVTAAVCIAFQSLEEWRKQLIFIFISSFFNLEFISIMLYGIKAQSASYFAFQSVRNHSAFGENCKYRNAERFNSFSLSQRLNVFVQISNDYCRYVGKISVANANLITVSHYTEQFHCFWRICILKMFQKNNPLKTNSK